MSSDKRARRVELFKFRLLRGESYNSIGQLIVGANELVRLRRNPPDPANGGISPPKIFTIALRSRPPEFQY